MSDEHLDRLAAIDEILQVMYWLRGERLAAEVTAAALARWLAMEAEQIQPLLERMHSSGLLQRSELAGEGTARYALTKFGVQEAGRRFADEFADMVRPGHGQCSDPNCDCHSGGHPADCVSHQH